MMHQIKAIAIKMIPGLWTVHFRGRYMDYCDCAPNEFPHLEIEGEEVVVWHAKNQDRLHSSLTWQRTQRRKRRMRLKTSSKWNTCWPSSSCLLSSCRKKACFTSVTSCCLCTSQKSQGRSKLLNFREGSEGINRTKIGHLYKWSEPRRQNGKIRL